MLKISILISSAVLGAKETEPERDDLYVISENAPKPVIAAEVSGFKSAPMVDPTGKVLRYVLRQRG